MDEWYGGTIQLSMTHFLLFKELPFDKLAYLQYNVCVSSSLSSYRYILQETY